MSKIDINDLSKNPDYCFAALKLIEQLFRDGKIPEYMFRNILSEYADIVDETEFVKGNHNQIKEESLRSEDCSKARRLRLVSPL